MKMPRQQRAPAPAFVPDGVRLGSGRRAPRSSPQAFTSKDCEDRCRDAHEPNSPELIQCLSQCWL